MANVKIQKPCRIICEGHADFPFLNALINARNIPHIEADCARLDKDLQADIRRCAGKNGITETLRGLKGYAEIEPGKLAGVIVAVDTDSDPRARLRETIGFIRAAGLNTPANYLDIREATKQEEFAVSILGIPWHDQPGNLDLLLLNAMKTTHADLMEPLDTFCEGTRARNGEWPIGPKSKMRLRCAIASSYRDDPGIALSFLFARGDCPINLRNPIFDPIAAFLTRFVDTVHGL